MIGGGCDITKVYVELLIEGEGKSKAKERTFISLFQLNWFEAQRLTKKRTDASGLLFNAYYACRLQFSIGFNYLLTLKWRTDKQSMIDPNDPSRPRVFKAKERHANGALYLSS